MTVAEAVDVLASLHAREPPNTLPVAPHLNYRLPRYDTDAFLIEAELLLDWYLAESKPPTKETRQSFATLWRDARLQFATMAAVLLLARPAAIAQPPSSNSASARLGTIVPTA